MPLLNPRDQDYLRGRFAEELENPVKLVHFTQNAAVSQLYIPGRENCLYCRETRELMEEVAGLTDKIALEVHEFRPDAPEAAALGVSRVPATVIQGTNKGRVRYFGIPAGRELPSFIDTLVEVSRGEVELAPETREALATLDQDIHIQVFFTPT
jgi:alkyl hydroperoxide reductase subunit AhpF